MNSVSENQFYQSFSSNNQADTNPNNSCIESYAPGTIYTENHHSPKSFTNSVSYNPQEVMNAIPSSDQFGRNQFNVPNAPQPDPNLAATSFGRKSKKRKNTSKNNFIFLS